MVNSVLSALLVIATFATASEDSVEYTVWLADFDRHTLRFLHDFAKIAEKIEGTSSAYFTPHYFIRECTTCLDTTSPVPHCLSGGRYCSSDYDTAVLDAEAHDQGRVELYEVLRQLCIYEHYGAKLWWAYIYAIADECEEPTSICSNKAMDSTTINPEKVSACVDASFEGEFPLLDDNTLLKKETAQVALKQRKEFPVVLVNGHETECMYDVNCLTDELCSLITVSLEECDQDGRQENQSRSSSFKSGFLLVLIVFSLIAIVLSKLTKRSTRPVTREGEGDGINELKQYISLTEQPRPFSHYN